MVPLCRQLLGAAGLVGIIVGASVSHLFWKTLPLGRRRPRHWRSLWLQTWARASLRTLRISCEVCGSVPESGLLVCNHLGYVDVLVLASLTPCVFVAKSDVRAWPVFGRLAAMAGTLFVDRRNARCLPELVRKLDDRLRQLCVVVLFPEGTSSGGDTVLPFRSSLLEGVQRPGTSLTVAALRHWSSSGRAARDVCYWDDMIFGPHLWHLLSLRWIKTRASLRPASAGPDRKATTRRLHDAVQDLHISLGVPEGKAPGSPV